MQDSELQYLRRCIELAEQALDAGDAPFGSVLVDAQGTALAEARNRIGGGDHTQHPEFELVRWAAQHMLGHSGRYMQETYRSDFVESGAIRAMDELLGEIEAGR